MFLDPRTFIVAFVAGNLLMALLLAVAFRGRLDTALRLWITNLLVQSAGWGVMLQCGPTASPTYPLVGFSLLSAALAILTASLVHFFGQTPRRAWPWWPVPVAILVFALTPLGSPERHMGAQLMLAVQMCMAAAYLLTRAGPWLGLRAVMAASGLLPAALLLASTVRLALGPDRILPCLPEPGSRESVAYLIFFVARFGFLFGFLLLIEARQREQITRLATLDPLTEAYNRRSFMELAEKELTRCRRKGHAVSLLFIDMDNFKRLNDQHGHLAGDQVLRQVKILADQCLRREDLFGRYGGEEFCLLAPETDLTGARTLAERLRVSIEQYCRQLGLGTTASIGIATLDQVRENDTLTEFLEEADQALYRAKAGGRNRVAC